MGEKRLGLVTKRSGVVRVVFDGTYKHTKQIAQMFDATSSHTMVCFITTPQRHLQSFRRSECTLFSVDSGGKHAMGADSSSRKQLIQVETHSACGSLHSNTMTMH